MLHYIFKSITKSRLGVAIASCSLRKLICIVRKMRLSDVVVNHIIVFVSVRVRVISRNGACIMRKKAFTLIELLVVISIIALLLSIMLPSLRKVKEQARGVVCKSNLKQWSLVFALYMEDNNQNFLEGINSWQFDENWMTLTKPYYENIEILMCPVALMGNPGQQIVGDITYYSDEAPIIMNDGSQKDVFVSYGINNWLLKPKPTDNIPAGLKNLYWGGPKNINREANKVPILTDAACRAGNPDWRDLPPEWKGQDWRIDSPGNQMKRFCLDRHQGAVQGVFADLSVQKVKLKQLWDIRWYRAYPKDYAEPEWPDWME